MPRKEAKTPNKNQGLKQRPQSSAEDPLSIGDAITGLTKRLTTLQNDYERLSNNGRTKEEVLESIQSKIKQFETVLSSVVRRRSKDILVELEAMKKATSATGDESNASRLRRIVELLGRVEMTV